MFITRSHHNDVVSELREQLLEQKRLNQALMAYIGIVPKETNQDVPEEAISDIADPFEQIVKRRPSQVVNMAERLMAKGYRDKHPELEAIEALGRAQAHSG